MQNVPSESDQAETVLQWAATLLARDFTRHSMSLEMEFGVLAETLEYGETDQNEWWTVLVGFNKEWQGEFTISVASPKELLVELAGTAQEFLFEYLHQSWPNCPRHDYPLGAGYKDTNPVWLCSKGPNLAFPIGELPNPIPDHG